MTGQTKLTHANRNSTPEAPAGHAFLEPPVVPPDGLILSDYSEIHNFLKHRFSVLTGGGDKKRLSFFQSFQPNLRYSGIGDFQFI